MQQTRHGQNGASLLILVLADISWALGIITSVDPSIELGK